MLSTDLAHIANQLDQFHSSDMPVGPGLAESFAAAIRQASEDAAQLECRPVAVEPSLLGRFAAWLQGRTAS